MTLCSLMKMYRPLGGQPLYWFAVLLAGCPATGSGDAALTDGGRDTTSFDAEMDASRPPDGGPDAGADASIADVGSDTPAPACADGGPIDLVAACEAAATDMSTRCGGGSDRECSWLATRAFCRTDRAEVLLAEMRCTAAFSSEPGGTGCRTFGDPSGARDCIVEAHACFDVSQAADVADRVGAAFTALCGSPSGASALHQAVVPFAALSSDTLEAIDACLPAADCDSLRDCVLAPFATIFACFP